MPYQHMLLMRKDGISDQTLALMDEVKKLQKLLKDWDVLAAIEPVDGMFGDSTDKALRLFQSKCP